MRQLFWWGTIESYDSVGCSREPCYERFANEAAGAGDDDRIRSF